VGTDPRLSGPALMDALVAGLSRRVARAAARSGAACSTDSDSAVTGVAPEQHRLYARAHGHRHHARLLHELHHARCARAQPARRAQQLCTTTSRTRARFSRRLKRARVRTLRAGYEYDASIMLTASHLPWNRNGMKFFTRGGGLGKKDISALVDAAGAAHAAAAGAPPRPAPGAPPPAAADFLPVYAAQLVALIRAGVAHPTHYDTPLVGFKIVVDAGNGSGGFFAAQVLAPLGADTRGSQFLDPDGHFPNHVPNPEEAAAVDSAAAAVRAAGADLGVIFDTDVDRSAIIDRSGAAINRNRLIALLAAVVLRERPGATIVTDSVTSDGLSAFIAAAGGQHYRYKRGYKNVIDKGVELAAAGVDAPLMIETSGHGAMAENHFLDDGAYLAVKVRAPRRACGACCCALTPSGCAAGARRGGPPPPGGPGRRGAAAGACVHARARARADAHRSHTRAWTLNLEFC
jgi:hypothetical protein